MKAFIVERTTHRQLDGCLHQAFSRSPINMMITARVSFIAHKQVPYLDLIPRHNPTPRIPLYQSFFLSPKKLGMR